MQARRFSGIDLYQILPAVIAAKPRSINGSNFAFLFQRVKTGYWQACLANTG